ncbi:MAG: hypothetical protein ACP5HP_03800 [Thermogladius sp.]
MGSESVGVLTALKRLVDDYEEILDFAKAIPYTSDRKLITSFIQRLADAVERTGRLEAEYRAADVRDPTTSRYIHTYYTYLTAVSIPYLKDLLSDAVLELEKKGLVEESASIRRLLEKIGSMRLP